MNSLISSFKKYFSSSELKTLLFIFYFFSFSFSFDFYASRYFSFSFNYFCFYFILFSMQLSANLYTSSWLSTLNMGDISCFYRHSLFLTRPGSEPSSDFPLYFITSSPRFFRGFTWDLCYSITFLVIYGGHTSYGRLE